MNAAVGGFAQGLAQGLGNLPGLMLSKQRLDLDKERFELLRAEHHAALEERNRLAALREAIGKGYGEGGFKGASDAAMVGGDISSAAGIQGLGLARNRDARQQDRFDRDMSGLKRAEATADQQQFGRTALAGWDPNVSLQGNLPHISRVIQQNPDVARKIFSLRSEQTPIGVDVVMLPDGTEAAALQIYNSRTKSIGPQTEAGTSAANDRVVWASPQQLLSTLNMWAGGETMLDAAAARRKAEANAKSGNQFTISDGWLYNKSTGAYRAIGDTPPGRVDRIVRHVGQMTDPKNAQNFDTRLMPQVRAIAIDYALAAEKEGKSGIRTAANAVTELLARGGIGEKVLEAGSTEERTRARAEFAEFLGLTIAPPQETKQAAKTEKKEPPPDKALAQEQEYIQAPTPGANQGPRDLGEDYRALVAGQRAGRPPVGGGAVGQSVEPLPGGGLPPVGGAGNQDAAEMEVLRRAAQVAGGGAVGRPVEPLPGGGLPPVGGEALRRGAQERDAGNGLLGRLRRTVRQALDAGGESARAMIEQLNLAARQGVEAAQIVLNELADVAGGIAEVGGGAAARITGTDAVGGAIAGGLAVLNENAAAMARRGNAALAARPPMGGGAVGQSVEPLPGGGLPPVGGGAVGRSVEPLPGGGLPAAARDAAEMEAMRGLPPPQYPLSRFIAEHAPERKDIANRAQSAFKSFQQMMREAVNGRDASPPLADDTFIAGNGLAARVAQPPAQPATSASDPETMLDGARLRPPRPVEWRNPEADKNPPRSLIENGTVPAEYVRGRDPVHVPVSIAQNNPLNVENQGQKFEESIDIPGQRFYGFKTPLAGIRAASRVLRQYQRGPARKMWDGTKRKPKTIRDIVYTWAPKKENESEAYARIVAEWSGIPIDAQIDTQDDAIQLRIIPAMIFVESGKTEQPYSEELIKRAIAASHYPSGRPVAQAPGLSSPAG